MKLFLQYIKRSFQYVGNIGRRFYSVTEQFFIQDKSQKRINDFRLQVKDQVEMFLSCMIFFTRIPAPKFFKTSQPTIAHSIRYFPMIGIIVGGFAALTFITAHIFWAKPIAIIMSMIATVLITGAFHEDGFADFCDSLGGNSPIDKLRIMKDSHLGSFGVTGLIMIFLLKGFALYQVNIFMIPFLLIAAHSASRFTAMTLMLTHPYVQIDETSKSKYMTKSMTNLDLWIAGAFGLLPLMIVNGYYIFALIPLIAVRWSFGVYLRRQLGGYTGDCLGTAQQLSEVVLYLFAAIT